MMAAITLEDMKSKLLSLEDVTRLLERTEPLATERLDSESTVRFSLDTDWAHGLDAVGETEVVEAEMSINGATRQITKEALLQAGANFGLGASYMRKIPAKFTEGLLNYHYGNGMGGNAFSALAVDDKISAFTRPSLEPFSNLQLLEQTVSGMQDRLGADVPIYADYKVANTLLRTDVRLITPAQDRIMVGTDMDDVPTGGTDTWFSGVHLSNSLIGKTQTSLEAYMFRWWCTNGATTTLDSVGTWSRRSGSENAEDVYEWARNSVDEILGGMDSMFDQVQALANLNVNGNTADVLREIFLQYQVPVSQRDAIMRRLLAMENITMYSIMAAISEAANEADLEDRRRDRLMRIGGALPTTTFDTLKARVWREGRAADETARNPYEPLILSV